MTEKHTPSFDELRKKLKSIVDYSTNPDADMLKWTSMVRRFWSDDAVHVEQALERADRLEKKNQIMSEQILDLQALQSNSEAGAVRYIPISEAPKDGTVILACASMKFTQYKPGARTQKKGRWQQFNGYGWENCKDQPTVYLSGSPEMALKGGE